jgi:hypothetical protein
MKKPKITRRSFIKKTALTSSFSLLGISYAAGIGVSPCLKSNGGLEISRAINYKCVASGSGFVRTCDAYPPGVNPLDSGAKRQTYTCEACKKGDGNGC